MPSSSVGTVAAASVGSQKFVGIRPAMHPGWRRCSSVAYSRYAPFSRLATRAPRRPRCNNELLRHDTSGGHTPCISTRASREEVSFGDQAESREACRRRAGPRSITREGQRGQRRKGSSCKAKRDRAQSAASGRKAGWSGGRCARPRALIGRKFYRGPLPVEEASATPASSASQCGVRDGALQGTLPRFRGWRSPRNLAGRSNRARPPSDVSVRRQCAR